MEPFLEVWKIWIIFGMGIALYKHKTTKNFSRRGVMLICVMPVYIKDEKENEKWKM